MIQLDCQSRTKKSDSDSQCCQESDFTQKPPTPYDSATLLRTALLTLKQCSSQRPGRIDMPVMTLLKQTKWSICKFSLQVDEDSMVPWSFRIMCLINAFCISFKHSGEDYGESMITLSRRGAALCNPNCASVSPRGCCCVRLFFHCNTARCSLSEACLLREAFHKLRCCVRLLFHVRALFALLFVCIFSCSALCYWHSVFSELKPCFP